MLSILMRFFLMTVVALAANSHLLANQYRSVATGNWNAAATWQISTNGGATWVAASNYPGQTTANDSVFVRDGHTVTMNVSPANPIGDLTVGEGAGGILTVGAFSITVNGTTTINANGRINFTSTTGTKNFTDVVINSGTWNSGAAETYTIGRNLTMNGGRIDGTSTGIHNVTGDFIIASGVDTLGRATMTVTGTTSVNATLNHTSITGTKTFNGDVMIGSGGNWNSIVAETYAFNGNVIMNGGTIGGTATGVHTVAGNFDIASGTNSLGQATITVTDTTLITGTLNITSSIGTRTFVGPVIVNATGAWDNSTGNSAIIMRNGLTNDGTFTSGSGTYTFNTNGQTLSGSSGLSFAANVAITGAITITNNTDVSIGGNLTGTVAGSTWLSGANSSLNIAGTLLSTGTLNATANTPNLVNYNGSGAQTVKATNYYNLAISGTRTTNNVTLPNSTIGIANDFTPSATFTTGVYVITGNTINYNGTGSQTITGFNYNNLTSSSTGTRTLDATTSVGIVGAFTPGTNSYTVTGSTVEFNGAGAQTIPAFDYNNLTSSSTGGRTLASTGTIRISEIFTPGTNTYTVTGSTVEFNGSGSQTIPASNYNNVVSSSTGPRILAPIGSIGIAGTFTPGPNSYTITGSTVNYNANAAQTITAFTYDNLTLSTSGAKTAGGALTVNGDLTFSGSASFNGGTSLTHDFYGSWIINTSATTPFAFTTSSIINFNSPTTPAQTSLGGTTTRTIAFNDVNINNTAGFAVDDNLSSSGTMTVGSNVTVTPAAAVIISGTGTLTGSGSVQVTRTAATANFASQYTITNKTLTNLAVEYAGTGQVLSNLTYSVLKVSGSITGAGNSATVSDSFIVSGTFTPTSGTMTLSGGSSITGTGNLTFSGLTIVGPVTGSKSFGVNGILTLNDDMSLGSNELTMGSAATTASTGDVIGNVTRTSFVTGTTYTFGNAFTSVNFVSGTLPSSMTMTLTKGSTPSGKSDAIQRYYTITETGGSGISATLRLHYLDAELNGNTDGDLALWSNSGSWADRGRTGAVNTTNKYAELSGLTALTGTWTLANASLDNFLVSFGSPQSVGVAFTGTNIITARDQNGNAITSFDASANNVSLSPTPHDGIVTGLGSSSDSVLNRSSDFVSGVATVTGAMRFVGQSGNHTFTATSASGKTGTSAAVALNRVTTNWSNSAVSSDWNDPANWTNGVPDSTMDVVIGNNSPPPRVPITNANCFDLTVNSGGLLLWESSGGSLYVHGNIVTTNGGIVDLGVENPPNKIIFLSNATFNNGGTVDAGNGIIDLKGSTWTNNSGSTFDPGTSTVIVDGTGDQTFNGDIVFYNLTVTNTDGSVAFSGDVVVNNDLTAAPGSDVQVSGGGSITVEGEIIGEAPSSPRPYMTSVVAVSTTQVDVTFNISVDETTAQTMSNYSLNSGTVSVTAAARDVANHAIVHLTVATLATNVEDTLVVNNVQDTLTNVIAANSKKRFTLVAQRVFYSRTSGNFSSTNSWSFASHTGSAGSIAPTNAGDTIVVGNGNLITLDVNVSTLGLLRVDSTGILDASTYVVSGSTTFELNAGSTLRIGSVDGIASSGSTGNIQTATRSFSKSANYVYAGSAGQVTGSGLPDTVRNLTVSNVGDATVTLSNGVITTGDLSVTRGVLNLGSTTANRATSGGTLAVSNGATLQIGGTNTLPSNYATHAVDSAGTIEYNGGNQTIAALAGGQAYGHLTLSGSGTKTLASGVLIRGNLTVIPPAVLDATGGTFTVNGNGDQMIAAATYGDLSVEGTGTKTFSSGSANIQGTFSVGGTATIDATTNTTTIAYNGSGNQTIPAINYYNLTLGGSGTKTFSLGTTGIAGALSISSAGDATTNATTLDYNGSGAQTISKFQYSNLSVSNAGVKTLADTVWIAGNFSVNGGATVNAPTNSLVSYNGSSAQSVAATTYWNVEFVNVGVKTIGTATMIVNNNMYILPNAQVVVTPSGVIQFTGDLLNDGVFINDGTISAN